MGKNMIITYARDYGEKCLAAEKDIGKNCDKGEDSRTVGASVNGSLI